MKVLPYIKSLLPSIERSTVVEDIGTTRDTIREAVIPAYEAAEPFFKTWKFKSDEMKGLISTFEGSVKGAGNDNMIVTISKSMDPILKNLDEIEDLIKRTYNTEVAGAGLTYQKANLLQFVECANFVARFSLKLLNYAYVCETSKFEDGEAIKNSLSKGEIQWIEQNMYNFALCVRICSGNPGQIKKQIADIPDVEIKEDTDATLEETLGVNRLDPLMMGFIPVRLNPIYHIRMFVANYQNSRYKAAIAERDTVMLRKMNLEMMKDGKADAATQKHINELQERVDNLNYKIKEMEEDYA